MKGPIYISGPMTGIADYNFPAFSGAAMFYRSNAFSVLNPAEQSEKDSWAEYMRYDIRLVCKSGSLVALYGWQKSKGARVEVFLAQQLSIPVYRAYTLDLIDEVLNLHFEL